MLKGRVRNQEMDTPNNVEELPSAEELIASIPFVRGNSTEEAPEEAGAQPQRIHRQFGHFVSMTYRTAKGLISKGVCGIGIHAGVWSYLDNDDSEKCLQGRTCRRCAGDKYRVRHHISLKPLKVNKCDFVRVCDRCETTHGEVTEHQWGNWSHDSWLSSDEYRSCRRCGASESRNRGG